jgi:hypothetical protein
MEKGIKTTEEKGMRLYDLLDYHRYILGFFVVNQWI